MQKVKQKNNDPIYKVSYRDWFDGWNIKEVTGTFVDDNPGYVMIKDKKGDVYRYRVEHETSRCEVTLEKDDDDEED